MSGPFKSILIDLSGTLHIESSPIAGAIDALKRLREANFGIRFVTNTTKESKRFLVERLKTIGFDIKPSEIFTSLTAARQLIVAKDVRPMFFLEGAAMEDFDGISTQDPNAVVIGLAPTSFHYEKLNTAFRLILNGAPLIAVHKARYYQTPDGPSLGPGSFITGLEYATDVKAEVVGKPMATFFNEAVKSVSGKCEETIMIGDDVRDDIGGAQQCGMMGILVKTGKYREGDETKINPPPQHVVPDFPAAVELILRSEMID
uniref:Haloacid dehalogenase-like hydrolase domain-containing protein 2 n=1 Tax=Strigamia maritima TaxID=126957 RepID=T1JMV9_STRMM